MGMPKGLGSEDELVKRIGNAEERWNLWRSLLQEAMEYGAPNRETFTIYSPGQKKNRRIYDSTAIVGAQQFANRIQGSIMPSWQQWMGLKSGDEIPKEEKDNTYGLLEEATETFFNHLNHSNFLFQDLVISHWHCM